MSVCITLKCDCCQTLEELQFELRQRFENFSCPNCNQNGMTVHAIDSELKQYVNKLDARLTALEDEWEEFKACHENEQDIEDGDERTLN